MPVTLESRARRMQVFHLAHDVCCRQHCGCAEVAVVIVAENPRTGERAPKRLNKKVPGSVTFLALERKPGLPSALLELAQVKAAIGRGYLRIIEQTPDKSSTPAATAAGTASGSPALSLEPTASGTPPSPAATSSSPVHSSASPPAPVANPPGKEP